MNKFLAVLLIGFSLISVPSWAADSDEGLDAYNSGDFETAFREWTQLAEKGSALAQFNLGQMYRTGQGVPLDKVYAHMWWKIASSNGSETAAGNRDTISEMMTPSQLEKAQDLTRECVAKDYKGC